MTSVSHPHLLSVAKVFTAAQRMAILAGRVSVAEVHSKRDSATASVSRASRRRRSSIKGASLLAAALSPTSGAAAAKKTDDVVEGSGGTDAAATQFAQQQRAEEPAGAAVELEAADADISSDGDDDDDSDDAEYDSDDAEGDAIPASHRVEMLLLPSDELDTSSLRANSLIIGRSSISTSSLRVNSMIIAAVDLPPAPLPVSADAHVRSDSSESFDDDDASLRAGTSGEYACSEDVATERLLGLLDAPGSTWKPGAGTDFTKLPLLLQDAVRRAIASTSRLSSVQEVEESPAKAGPPTKPTKPERRGAKKTPKPRHTRRAAASADAGSAPRSGGSAEETDDEEKSAEEEEEEEEEVTHGDDPPVRSGGAAQRLLELLATPGSTWKPEEGAGFQTLPLLLQDAVRRAIASASGLTVAAAGEEEEEEEEEARHLEASSDREETEESTEDPPTAPAVRLRAMYDYTAVHHDELSLVEDAIYIGLAIDDDGEWWTGMPEEGGEEEDRGERRIFPANFVERVDVRTG